MQQKLIKHINIGSLFKHRQKLSYIFINIFMAVLGFTRSYVTMKYLGFYQVGLVAMLMSVIEFVSMLQMGLLNGGFRMYFVNTKSVNKHINSMLFSYLAILLFVSLSALAIYVFIKGSLDLRLEMIGLGIIVGIFTLTKTWCTNLMIAAQKLGMLNKLNIWSSMLSFCFIFLVPVYGLTGAILLVISQPIIFITSVLWLNRELRPTGFFYKKSLLRKLMFFGFIPFLAGILVKVDDQVERWGIINILGLENFGKYNLVLIYCSVFMLVPASLNPIFFPRAILQYKENNSAALKKTLTFYVIILFSYTIFVIGATILMMPYLVNLFLPKYNVGVQYVWYILPYVVAQMLIMPLDFIYTLTAKFRVMFVSYTASVLLFVTLIFIINSMAVKKLEYFAIAKSLDGFAFMIISCLGFYFFIRKGFLKRDLNS